MKKLFLIAVAAVGMMTANAQTAYEATNFGSNWSVGLDGGATTPLKGHSFFQNMRGIVGVHVDKQISPVVGLGVEAAWGINTSTTHGDRSAHSGNVFDSQYVGAYGSFNLMNLFAGYNCAPRFFEIEAVAGAGWGHLYYPDRADHNYFATKAGLNFNFNVCPNFTVALKPSVTWDMTDVNVSQTSAAYDIRGAHFNIMVGLTYHFGKGFQCTQGCDPDLIASLNGQINALRADLEACNAALAQAQSRTQEVSAELEACQSRPPRVIEKVKDNLESVRYIYYAQSSSTISNDQARTVDIIASFMKNHPDSKLDVKGYASPEGNPEFNNKLAAARAQSVKTMLVNKYKISADRIDAEGQGIGNMFSEPSWNRVAICTLDK